MPTLAGFQWFVASIMGIGTAVLPADAPVIAWVFGIALATVNPQLQTVPAAMPGGPSIYVQAVYNLAGDLLLNFAPDQPGQTYFETQRGQAGLNLNNFQAGVVNTAGDQGTSGGLTVPDQFSGLTIADLQNLKTPYGRTYLGIAQSVGTLVGLT